MPIIVPDADLIADRTYLENPGSQMLYQAATGFERALADADTERLIRIYAEIIIDQWDPWRISLNNLPFLAWAMGVNLWDNNWHETTKRLWVARQWQFKALRGTADGMRMAMDFVSRDVTPFGYQVRGLTVPPQRVYSGPSLTREQREEWLAMMPQLRVWRTFERGTAGLGKLFYGGRGTGRQHDARFCLGSENVDSLACTIVPTTAIDRLKRRARWIVRGVETDVTVSEFGTYWRLHLRSIEDSKVFVGRPFNLRRFYIPSTAHERLITIMPQERLSWRSPVWASLEPVTAEPERISINGLRRHHVFSGGSDPKMQITMGGPNGGGSYYVPSDAWSRIFQRFAINDGTAETNKRQPVQFMGTGRYGFPKYTAWARLSLRSIRRWAVFDGVPSRHFFLPHDPTPVQRAKTAVQASKKIADKILLELGPMPRFVAGRPFLAGTDFIVGRP